MGLFTDADTIVLTLLNYNTINLRYSIAENI